MGPFTSVFGMGTGVASPPWPPGKPGPGLTARKTRQRTVWAAIGAALQRTAGIPPPASNEVGKNGQASRLISNGPLSPLLDLHARPIEVVVCHLPSGPFGRENLSSGRLGA